MTCFVIHWEDARGYGWHLLSSLNEAMARQAFRRSYPERWINACQDLNRHSMLLRDIAYWPQLASRA